MSFKISWKIHVLCTLLAYLLALPLTGQINSCLDSYVETKYVFIPTGNIFVNLLLYILLVMSLITIVHEMIHGITYIIFGGRIRFGFKIMFVYTQETSGILLTRTQFAIVLLAPLTIMSIGCLLVNNIISNVVFILNLLGSTGDIIMAFYLFLCPARCNIIDRSYGFDAIENT